MYSIHDKMSVLMRDEHQALSLINRFGLPLGVGEKTIDQVCKEQGIDSDTFVRVVNYAIELPQCAVLLKRTPASVQADVPTLLRYIRNGHTYFLDFQLPRIRQELISAVAGNMGQIPMLILRFYDEYVEEIRAHIDHENKNEYHLHPMDDQHISAKLIELKSLIIKYYPGQANSELFAALHDICEVEEEIKLHCAIEEEMLIPALQSDTAMPKLRKPQPAQEENELSQREKDVLQQVVKGLSNKEIADVLCISVHTVISHRKNIARKLNIHSAAGLTIYAIVNGMIDL